MRRSFPDYHRSFHLRVEPLGRGSEFCRGLVERSLAGFSPGYARLRNRPGPVRRVEFGIWLGSTDRPGPVHAFALASSFVWNPVKRFDRPEVSQEPAPTSCASKTLFAAYPDDRPAESETAVERAYALARERYESLGVDVERALARLSDVAVSLHCWQGDDVAGFENRGEAIARRGAWP